MSNTVEEWVPNSRNGNILVCPECSLGISLDTMFFSDCNMLSDESEWCGYAFDSININFCPRCGQRLKLRKPKFTL